MEGRLRARLEHAIIEAPRWVGGWLLLIEVSALTLVALVIGLRGIQFGIETGWSFRGLLHILDENWRGALILAAALFYRTAHMVIARMKSFYTVWGEAVSSGEVEVPAHGTRGRS